MFEILQNFEEMALRLSPAVLIVPGVACIISGLFVWLGGLGFGRALAAVAGTVSGGICGFFVVGRNVVFAAVLALVAGFVAVTFERKFFVLLAAVLAAVIGIAVLTGPYIGSAGGVKHYPEYETQGGVVSLGVRQSLETMKGYGADVRDAVKQAYLHMPVYKLAIVIALVVIFIAAGIYFWRLTSALCCATLGTILIFAGMVLLLLHKGTAPISDIYRRGTFYLGVFGAMAAFGTIEQLLFCPRIKAKMIARKEKKDKQQPEQPMQDWRNR
ncbi:MAG: hypothetical protein ACYS0C_05155 [Planctomycetota bacterium]|jgi:hypothetical protein